MTVALDLAAGLTVRPLVPADASAVTAVIAAQELVDVGAVVIEEADIIADWQRPGYDVSAVTVGVYDDDRLVAYAEVAYGDRGHAAVHPDCRGRGIGTWLASWMQQEAREKGCTVIGMPVPQVPPATDCWSRWATACGGPAGCFSCPRGQRSRTAHFPTGYTVRAATEADWQAAFTVNEDAFLEWSQRERDTFEIWQSQVVRRPGFEPWHLRVVTDPGGDVAATALLVDALAAARQHGATRFELSTDSRTGAHSLYEKVGMRVTSPGSTGQSTSDTSATHPGSAGVPSYLARRCPVTDAPPKS